MNEKYNELPNLDPTIELDGTEYNLTAVDALWADIARRVEEGLDITLSEHIDSKDNTKITYDGDNSKSISIVPSTGGVFTGHIVVPDPPADSENDSNKDKYAINLKNVNTLIQKLKGFPTYIWNGSELEGQEPEVNSDSLSPFKVVLYSQATNNPTAIRFSDDNGYIDCYFFAVNLSNGYLSLGHCFKEAATEYVNLAIENTYKLKDPNSSNNYTYNDLTTTITSFGQRMANVELKDSEQDERLKTLEDGLGGLDDILGGHKGDLTLHTHIVWGASNATNTPNGSSDDDKFKTMFNTNYGKTWPSDAGVPAGSIIILG